MGYQQAVEKAWSAFLNLSPDDKPVTTKFLSDAYTIDPKARAVLSGPLDAPAKDHIAIILLHYLAAKLRSKTLPPLTGEWVDFNELEGGEGYYPAFKKRTIDRILKKYGHLPDSIKDTLGRFSGAIADKGDVGIVIYPLDGVPILITLSKADEEFGPDANILFDKNISNIFCTEDIVVLTEIVAHTI
ncbi:MAG: DUF3786 domain-containing protein [Candidatus Omnitrophica bacterium]|nr:DUF3786 domain-containing protein [Candidatus Omnitrophota bacterium]MDD5437128.1 DUF3786 domain-containing protein [Candidatus Omnitrophota bacterium]